MEEQQYYGLSFYLSLQHDFSNLLKIPQEAVRELKIVPQKCRIKGTAQRCWDVSIEAVGNDLYFLQGWSSFVSDHSLTKKDLLTFTQCGASELSVKVFGENGVEKVACLTEEDTTFVEAEARVKVAKAASSSNGQAAGFSVAMSAYYVRGHKLTVPTSFAKNHLEGKAKVKLQVDGSGKCWSLKVTFGPRAASLHAGWSHFAKDNNLKEGDVCAFKLLHKAKEPLIHVSISRN